MAAIDGSVQDCGVSNELAMEILQSCAEPSTYHETVYNAPKDASALPQVWSRPCGM